MSDTDYKYRMPKSLMYFCNRDLKEPLTPGTVDMLMKFPYRRLEEISKSCGSSIESNINGDLRFEVVDQAEDHAGIRFPNKKYVAKFAVYCLYEFGNRVTEDNKEVIDDKAKYLALGIMADLFRELDCFDDIIKEVTEKNLETNFTMNISDDELRDAYDNMFKKVIPDYANTDDDHLKAFENDMKRSLAIFGLDRMYDIEDTRYTYKFPTEVL